MTRNQTHYFADPAKMLKGKANIIEIIAFLFSGKFQPDYPFSAARCHFKCLFLGMGLNLNRRADALPSPMEHGGAEKRKRPCRELRAGAWWSDLTMFN